MMLSVHLRALLLGFLMLVGASQGFSRIVYVDSSRTAGSQNGNSWANAYSSLQTALNAAVAGDSLWIAKGTYYPGASGANSASFVAKSNVRLYGGFTGFSGAQETQLTQRNWNLNRTILSGDLDKSGTFSSADAYHVIFAVSVDTSATFDGFRVTGGNAFNASGSNDKGGGILIFAAGLRVVNCDIVQNRALVNGGGVYGNGHIVMEKSFVRNNYSAGTGGGSYMVGATSVLRYYNCVFSNNTSVGSGGAFVVAVSNARFYNCTFSGNTASVGSTMRNIEPAVLLKNCIIWGESNPNTIFDYQNPVVTRSIVQNGLASGTFILNANPNFLDSDFRIKACSPAADAGDSLTFVTTDLDGAARPFDVDLNGVGKWDLGAFEAQVPAIAPSANTISGPNPSCANQDNVLYQPGTNNSPTNQYSWSLSGGGSIDGSATGNSVQIDWGGTLGTYTITMLEYGAVSGCSTSNTLPVTLQPSPTSTLTPNGAGAICAGDSILLSGSGSGISQQWYRNGQMIPGATGTTVFAKVQGVYNMMSNGSNGCSDSASIAYQLTVNPLPVFSIGLSGTATLCQGQTVTLTAPSTGNSWQWFRNGNPIGGATAFSFVANQAGSYNVQFTNSNGCRNTATAPVTVVVNPLPVVSITPPGQDTICPSTSLTISASAAGSSTWQWYQNGSLIGGATASSYVASTSGLFNAVITDGNGCRDSASLGKRLIVGDFVPPLALCQNRTVYLGAGGTATLTAASVNNGSSDDCAVAGVAISQSTFNCGHLGGATTTLTVTDAGGNTSQCNASVTVLDTIRPSATCQNRTLYLNGGGSVTLQFSDINNGSADNCGISNSSVSPSTFNCSQVGVHPVVGTITDASGNSRNCTVSVTVTDSTRPAAVCANPVLTLDAGGNASLLLAQVENGSSDNCAIATQSLSRTSFSCVDVPGVQITMSVTDVNGNTGICQSYIRVQDLTSPVAVCRDTSIFIDNSGQSNLIPANIDNGSTDNCTIASRLISQSLFTCQDTGLNPVTLSIYDADTNLATCVSLVRVYDTIAPAAICSNVTFYLDQTGNVTVDPLVVGASSTDNCGFFDTTYVDVGQYSCAGIGSHPTLLVVADIGGARDSCISMVTIADSTGPNTICRNFTISLVAGNANITVPQVDNGTTDNCMLDTVYLDKYAFTCADVGVQNVLMTAVDIYGNDNRCIAQVTVTENTPPTAVCSTATLYLNSIGQATLTAADIDNGSSDNCGISGRSLSNTSFTCNQVGANPVTLTVTDAAGNTAVCSTSVQILDTIRPTAVCTPKVIYLSNGGSYNLTASEISGGSADNCGIASQTVAPSVFSCQDTGLIAVTISLVDPSGNTRQCQTTISLVDSTPPVPVCNPATVYLSALGIYQLTPSVITTGTTDNCGLATTNLSQENFSCANLGANTVQATFRDISGNTSACSVTVTVLDSVAPTAVCRNTTVYLDGNGSASLAATVVDSTSSDLCGIDSRVLSQASFSCADAGIQTVALTVSDASGNASTCLSQVTVIDSIRPIASCTPMTVFLDGSGIATVGASLVGANSFDQCGGLTFQSIPASFSCSQIGTHTVSIQVLDPSGNVDSCSVAVQVMDSLAPVAICQSIVAQVDSNGLATITPQMVGGNSTDNCGIANLSLDISQFSCSDFGANQVVLIVQDTSGLVDSCQATVTVSDPAGLATVHVDLGPDTTLCNGLSTILQAPSGLSSYIWSTGFTGTSITASSSGVYWVQVSNSQGCQGLDTIVVSTATTPDPHLVSESGNAVICQNDTLILSVDPGFVSYQWSTGGTTPSISVTTGGNYIVQVTDQAGCSVTRNISVQSVPFPAPAPQITPAGPVSICEGESVLLDAGSGYFSYLWSSGQTTQAITIGQQDTVQVQVWNGFGCHSYSDFVLVNLNPSPVPLVQQNGDTLFSSISGAQYQWLLNGVAVPGANANNYLPLVNGAYSVEVTYPNGCSQVSAPWTFTVGIIGRVETPLSVSVFPNPTSGVLQVMPAKPVQGKVSYSVTNALGKKMLHGNWNNLTQQRAVDLGNLPAGMYFLELNAPEGRVVISVVRL